MRVDMFKGMPSGTDYGDCLNWVLADDGDFIVAFFANGDPFGDMNENEFHWVVETRSGNVVFHSEEKPIFNPAFGLDVQEWRKFTDDMLPVMDAYIASGKKI